MADTIVITQQDRIDAENILVQFLGDLLPEADFSKGSVMRDFVIQSMANIFAYLEAEKDITRARQSLLLLGKLAGVDVDDAVDEILSNWYINRNQGQKATGVATAYFTQRTDVEIPVTARFYKTANLAFKINADDSLIYSEDDMTAITDSEGVVIAYTISVPLIATQTGADYNVEAGAFADFTRFSPYITRVESEVKFSGGGGNETTTEMLDRSETAISVRDLNSARSIDVTLKEEFNDVEDVTVIGYGDDEMLRDLILEEATNTRIHAGGFVDAYLRAPILESQTFEGVVGGEFTDPRPGYYVLRDDTITDFEALGINVGDVMIIHNAVTTSEANQYIIKRITPYGIYVSRRSPFPMELPEVEKEFDDGEVEYTAAENRISSGTRIFTSDDVDKYIRIGPGGDANNVGMGKITSVNTTPNYAVLDWFPNNFNTETGVTFQVVTRIVEYTVGDNSPYYNNKIDNGAGNPRITGRFTKSIQNDGRILLPGRPIYRITDVSFPGGTFPTTMIDTDGRVRFPNRVNHEPTYQVYVNDMEFQIIGQNPEEVPSGWQVLELDVGWPDGGGAYEQKNYFNGQTLRVTYDTLTGYDSVWAFMLSKDRRIQCGSVIPRGLHPVYLTIEVKYKLAKTATSVLDVEAATEALVEYINNFDTREDIDVSDVSAFVRANFSEVGYVEPVVIYYALLSPDGRVIHYKTTDLVSIDPDKQIDPTTDLPPTLPEDMLNDPISVGVSDNTVRYLTVDDLITFTNLEA